MITLRQLERFLFAHLQCRDQMSGKQFFIDRYAKLGWEFKEIELKQSIRINPINAKAKNLPERLRKLGVDTEKIPFLPLGYWVTRSVVSPGATAEYLLRYVLNSRSCSSDSSFAF